MLLEKKLSFTAPITSNQFWADFIDSHSGGNFKKIKKINFLAGKLKLYAITVLKKIESYHIILLLAVIIFIGLTADVFIQDLWNKHIDFQKGSYYGGLLSGLFAFLSVILIAFTLKNQSDTSKLSRFEDRFFQLMQIQRDNSENIILSEIKGRKVFIMLLDEFALAYKIVTNFIKTNELNYFEREIIDIAYHAFFYGVEGEKSRPVFSDILVEYQFTKKQIDAIIRLFIRSRKEKKHFYVYFEGHQVRLGHYYRHMFQSVDYINKQKSVFLSYQKRYEYVKIFRAQLSTQEQILLFLNSLSKLGRSWEMSVDCKNVNDKLITKFNMLSNIAISKVYSINIREYYPLLVFEGDNKNELRARLEKEYL
jgi:hypothetical protein